MKLLHVILICSLLQFGRSCDEDKLAKLIDRVSTLEGDVQKLKSQAVGRNELIRLLELNIAELTGENSGSLDNSNENSGSTDNSNEKSGTDDKSSGEEAAGDERISPVTVLEVRREWLDSKVKFTVKYRSKVDDYTIQWHDYSNYRHMADHTDQSLSDGTRETSILVSPGTRRDNTDGMGNTGSNFTYSFTEAIASVYFLSNNTDGLQILLRNGYEDAVETDILLPALKIEPPGDLVYDDGEDILVKLTTPPDVPNHGPVRPDIDFQSYLIDPDSGKVVTNLGHKIVELLDNKTFPKHREWNIKWKTSKYKTSGILHFSTKPYSKTESSLVQGVLLGKFVILRPSTQDGPFPVGFLDWVTQSYESYRTEGDGAVLIGCSAKSDTCGFNCMAAGDDITGVEVYKVESDGTKDPVESIPRFEVFRDNLVSVNDVLTTFLMNTTTTDSERFSCVATNALGKTVTQDYRIDYYIPATIVHEESEIQIINVDEVSSTLELKIVCRVKGRPQPNVTFTMHRWSSYEFGISPDEISYEGEDEINALKYYIYNTSDPYSYNEQYKGRLASASCTVDSGTPYFGHDFYIIPMPTELQTR